MNDVIKWFCKTTLVGIFWVFFLSISVNGRSIFSHAHEIFVENVIVEYLDEELADLWSKIQETARVTFSEASDVEKRG